MSASRPAPETATDRLTRLLTMVPWLVNRQGIDTASAAAEFGVSVQQLESDLSLIFLCGYGQMPDELIEADWEGGRVFVSNADAIAKPLRLGVDEAVTLIVGLRALRHVSAVAYGGAVDRALAKLEAAVGPQASGADRIAVAMDDAAVQDTLKVLRGALAERRRVHVSYFVPGRDEQTERDVDPIRLVGLDGRWYLEGWCHRAGDTRLFRLDRIVGLTVLEVDGTPPEQAVERDLAGGSFRAGPDDVVVTLRLLPGATWVADYYPVESREDTNDAVTVQLRTADTEWLVRLLRRLGGRGIVLDPPDVASAVRSSALSALAAYDV